VEFKLFGKHIAGTPSPIKPDSAALRAYKQGLETHSRVAVGGVHNVDRLITRVEMAGWKLQFNEPHPAGDRAMLTFRRVGP
jgi:hypothetical protein